MIAQSQSGTGKTAAFVLTMLSRVVVENPWPQVCTNSRPLLILLTVLFTLACICHAYLFLINSLAHFGPCFVCDVLEL